MLTGRNYVFFIITLTMMSMMGLLASDVYIPALSTLSEELKSTPQDIQLTLGVYLFGLSFFQLFYGPLSDHYGRKPVLMVGFVIYTLGSIGCVLAQTTDMLIAARFLQAIGACAGLVIGRAIIADLFTRDEATKIYNIVYPLVAASPAIAPFIGGYLATWFGWRSTFVFVVVFGLALIAMTMKFLQETKKKEAGHESKLTKVFFDAPKMFIHPLFLRYIVCVCAIYGAWFTYLSQATFLFSRMGYEAHQIGYFYFPLALAIYVGNYICKICRPLMAVEKTFLFGLLFFVLGSIAFIGVADFTQTNHAYELIVPMAIVAVANGIILPLGIPSAVALFPKAAGSASGTVGFCQIGFAALCASFSGSWFGITVHSLAMILLVLAVSCTVLYAMFSFVYFGLMKKG